MAYSDASSFADRLMQSESSSDALRHRHEEKRLALTERRLTSVQKWMGWLALPLYIGLIGGLGYRLLTTNPSQPREWMILEIVCALGLLAIGLWILRVLLRGSRVTWRDDRAMEWISLISLCGMSFAFFEIAQSLEDIHIALRLHGCITVLLVGGVISLLLERIRRAKLETRVKLLELELRLLDLAPSTSPVVPASTL